MYSLSIFFSTIPVPSQFLFKDEEKASVVYNAYVDYKMNHAAEGVLIGADDFGQSFAIPFLEIRGIILEDMDLGEEARPGTAGQGVNDDGNAPDHHPRRGRGEDGRPRAMSERPGRETLPAAGSMISLREPTAGGVAQLVRAAES